MNSSTSIPPDSRSQDAETSSRWFYGLVNERLDNIIESDCVLMRSSGWQKERKFSMRCFVASRFDIANLIGYAAGQVFGRVLVNKQLVLVLQLLY
ncbi:uncharacterized protein PHALS_15305 [Plasmopara halstedii]|uniref:Uncharacterized protein n=1 Tax=Plasmopara halstedii TaxID=4781 RepID=A0A0P1AS52_PLAHL|nr:uncharacterized protein PHALS_15305 [Plasmopara halstedii]CEG44550.1 hypothetical protein PHALS_15305 [Plasmopara halstedii]|eukprot:XP_024580919.1 hypothetical protein PHALS_15305 [Plasmopara halstedii]